MPVDLKLGDISARVVRKNIKHIHLRILEPSHEVRISVPAQMPIETAQALAMTKFEWLSHRLEVLRAHQQSLPPADAIDTHCYVWGKRYRLRYTEAQGPPGVSLDDETVSVSYRSGAAAEKQHAILDQWYRRELQEQLAPLRATWEQRMGVEIGRLCLQRMKTRWGSSNNATRTIRINVEMAKKPPQFLEYLLVHEMTHFFHNGHGTGFQTAMNHWMPDWRRAQHELNIFPRN